MGVHGYRHAGVGPHTNVLVLGAGPIGLVTLMAAKAFGSPRVVIVDVDESRLDMAKSLGAHGTLSVSTSVKGRLKVINEYNVHFALYMYITLHISKLEGREMATNSKVVNNSSFEVKLLICLLDAILSGHSCLFVYIFSYILFLYSVVSLFLLVHWVDQLSS